MHMIRKCCGWRERVPEGRPQIEDIENVHVQKGELKLHSLLMACSKLIECRELHHADVQGAW